MEELLKKVAEIRGMPASLDERSAQARATETGTTVEAVLRDWAGESADDVSDEAPAADDAASSPPAADEGDTADPSLASPTATVGVPSEITDEYLVKLAAEAKRMPEKLLLSSAETRAKNGRIPLQVVLADWANVDLDDLKAQAAEAPVSNDTPAKEAEPTPAPQEEQPVEQVAPAAGAATGAAISVEALLDQVAEARGMPASLTKRSAEARAKETGGTLESVLAEWAGIDPATVGATAPTPETPAAAAPADPAAAPPVAAAAAAATIGMDELLEKVAEAKGMPAALAKRSAEARAKKTGEPLEAVLAEWAGVDPATVRSGSAPAAAPAATATPAPPSEEGPSEVDDDIEVIEPVSGDDEGGTDVVSKIPSPAGRYPTWLAAAFLIIPLLAVMYIVLSPNGPDCGSGGQLLVNPVTGDAVNCDGTDYGTFSIDYLANGGAIYTQCAACHNANGSGGVGPAFVGGSLLTTFPAGSCADQIEWITLGTAGFPEPTYGAIDKPVGGFGVMPGFGNSLAPSQIAQVALYERVQFGGESLEEAEMDCGLVDADGVPIPIETIDAAGG